LHFKVALEEVSHRRTFTYKCLQSLNNTGARRKMNKHPWPESYVEQRVPSPVNLSDYAHALNGASDERPMQAYLAAVPAFFRRLLPACTDFWCFDRPALGGELIPDFLLCYRNSRGFNWVYVELETPTKGALLKSGRPSAKLHEGIAQITDWRDWLRENISYARDHLRLKQIDAESIGIVIIGRRTAINPKHALKYRSLSSGGIIVMSYDRLMEPETHSSSGGTP